MSDELVFYTHPMSRGRIVRWMLEEVGAPYRTEVIDYGPKMKSTAYLAINPMGKVPALAHGSHVVTECAAICAYLADAFPAAGLAPPPGSRSRADYYRWLFFAAGPLEAAVADKVLGAAVPAEKQGMIGYGNFDLVVATLDQALAGKTALVDGRFSAADVYVGSHLMWGKQFGTLPKRPSFESYCAGLAGRPASTRASAIDDALVPNHPMPSR